MKYLFVISYLVFFVGLVVFKKTDKKINIIRYLVLQVIITMIFSVMLMTLLFLFGSGTNLMFVSSILGILGLILIFLTIKRKDVQKYEFKWIDLVATVLIMMAAVLVSIKLFGTDLHIAYNNADPAAHFYMAQNNLINQSHSGMYYYEVNNALLMNGLSLFTNSVFSNYKLYLIIEIWMFALSGLTLYVLIVEFASSNFRRGLCALLSVLYMLGYSLNNMIFGFGYLGVAVTLICFLMIVCKKLWDGKINLKVFVPLMAMGVLSLALCYMLFAPAIWILVFTVVLVYCRKKKMDLKKIIVVELGVFAVPFVVALKFCFFDFFLATNLSVSEQLRALGGAYENYITNFIIIIPIGLFAIIQNVRKKKHFVSTLFVVGWISFVVLAAIAKQMDLISPYYFLKTYYVMWLMAFVIFADGMMQLMNLCTKFAGAYFAIMIGMVVVAPFANGNPLVDVYEYNFRWLAFHDVIGAETMKAYRYATNEIVEKGERITWVTNITQYGRAFWFYAMQAMIANECDYCQPWNYNEKELVNVLKDADVKYAGIYKFDPGSYSSSINILKKGKVVFETSEIAIYELELK